MPLDGGLVRRALNGVEIALLTQRGFVGWQADNRL
jgi:hypothetical protein